MRPIKYRAWNNYTDEMIHWDELQDDHYGKLTDFNDPVLEFMQYTGLKDKNGREIYEGDIFQLKSLYIDLETGNQHIETECIPVIFERGAFFLYERGIKHHSLYDILRGFGQGESSNEWGTEVVGNIYEDKHLLEVES